MPLFVLAHCAHHLVTALPIPLLPLIRSDFALDYTQSGLVYSAFSLAYGIGQVPAGWLADRIGYRWVITMGICGVAVAGLLVGLSPTYTLLLVFLALMGLLGGGYHPAAPPAIAASSEPQYRGRALGLHVIGGSVSFFLTPLIAAGVAGNLGWRWAFIGMAVPAMIFGIIIHVLLGRHQARKEAKPSTMVSYSDVPAAPGHRRRLVVFIILTTIVGAVTMSSIAFIALFLVDSFGVSEETAARSIAIIYSAGLWASPLGGYLSDRLGRVPVILAVCFIVGPALYLLNIAPYGIGIWAVLVVIGMTLYVRMPVAEAYIISRTSERHRSTVLGIYYFGGMEGGGVLTPVMGRLIDNFGFKFSFTMAGVVALVVTLVGAIFLWGDRD